MNLLRLAALAVVLGGTARAEEDCVIPPGPPCLAFDDPRWENPNCKVSVGSCWYVLTESVKEPLIKEATVTIVPVCSDPSSHAALKDAAFKLLSGLPAYEIEVTVVTEPCSSDGYADIKIGPPSKNTWGAY